MQSDCVDLGQQITIYRLKPVDGEILIEETGAVIYVNVRNQAMNTICFRVFLFKGKTQAASSKTFDEKR